ncbi:MAG: TatD family hydrolase [Candidatus Woesearchaeota archaeon]|nr:TatD family hydrolase [Candidatus Woesearchaeota archaeon]
MGLLDVHCHLDFPQFDKDLNEVIERARNAGVKFIVQNGVNPKSNRKSIIIAEKYPDIVKLALGLYPVDALDLTDEQFDDELKFIENNKDRIVALGEVGIDHHWAKEEEKDSGKKQAENFEKIITLAEKIRKPLIVHSRDAEKEAFELLQSSGAKKVVMHCFNADFDTIKKAEDAGYYFTVPCIIVRSKHFQKMAKKVSLDRLFTETDAPFMSPFQGKRNEPVHVAETIKKIAEILDKKEKDVEDQMIDNYKRFFGK